MSNTKGTDIFQGCKGYMDYWNLHPGLLDGKLFKINQEQFKSSQQYKFVDFNIPQLSSNTPIYSRFVNFILSTVRLKYTELDYDVEEVESGKSLMPFYQRGYDSGIHHFHASFRKPEDSIRDIHQNLYHRHNASAPDGWLYEITNESEILSPSALFRYGFYAGLYYEIITVADNYSIKFNGYKECDTNCPIKIEQESILVPDRTVIENSFKKPVFDDNIQESLYAHLKNYFSVDQHQELRSLIASGEKNGQYLNFEGSGMQLASVFKKLLESKLIVIRQKSELQNWIMLNFRYKNVNGQFVNFKMETLVSYFPASKHCQDPILEIREENGKFLLSKPTNRIRVK